MKRRILAIIVTLAVFAQTTVFASILGEEAGGW